MGREGGDLLLKMIRYVTCIQAQLLELNNQILQKINKQCPKGCSNPTGEESNCIVKKFENLFHLIF